MPRQVNESAGFPHDLPPEIRRVVSSLGMPKVLMLVAEQHCDRAMRTDGGLRAEEPATHPLGELCKVGVSVGVRVTPTLTLTLTLILILT